MTKKSNLRLGVVLGAGMAVLFVAISVFLCANQADASPAVQFEQFAVHPYASQAGYDQTSTNYYTDQKLCVGQDFCPVGQTLRDMEITPDGTLVAGYGDWNSNVDSFGVPAGRVGVVPLNLATKQWGSITYAGSEALDTVRQFDGKLYTVTTDPSDQKASGQATSNESGYMTNQSGGWQFVSDGQRSEHLFDMQKAGSNEYWLFGASQDSAATAWRSTDGGAHWQVARQDTSAPGQTTGYERYYWGAVLNGKVYMHAGGTNPAVPGRIYDTASDTWSDWAGAADFCSTTSAKQVVTYDGSIVCADGSNINTFDGQTVQTKAIPQDVPQTALDFYVDGSKLYVLTSQGMVYRLNDLAGQFEMIGGAESSAGAQTLAVYDDYVYLGGDGGKIWRSTTTIANATVARPVIDSIDPSTVGLDGSTQTVTVKGSSFGPFPSIRLGGKTLNSTVVSDGELRLSVDTQAYTLGKVSLSITNQFGETTTLADAIEFVPDDGSNNPGGTSSITAVQAQSGEQAGSTRLHVTGTGLLEPLVSASKQQSYWAVGLRTKLIKLDGQPLPACVSQETYDTLKNYYPVAALSTDTPCYKLIDYDLAANTITPRMTNTGFDIIVPSSSSAAAHGSVQIAGGTYGSMTINPSNTFVY